MIDENKNIYISYWLLLMILLLALMITIGGITRITDSGLSITKWDLFTGILPPLSLAKWEELFNLYKQIPEYKLLNSSMTLEGFKNIFWWEYIHRLLGRIIGIFYILPLFFFTYKKILNKKSLIILYLIFFLICFQGFVGWYMVQSGLSVRTDVSHYRLSIHLTIAFIIFIFLIWNYLFFSNSNIKIRTLNLPFKSSIVFLVLILIQISLGAFVSGLDAGKIYQTWPLMNSNYFPDDVTANIFLTIEMFETPSLVQFFHRNLAYIIFIYFLFIFFLVFREKNFYHLRKSIILVFIVLSLQIVLGILTILSGAHMYLAITHQLGSVFLIISSLNLIFNDYKTN